METKCVVPIFLCRQHCSKHCYREDGSLIYDHDFICKEQHEILDDPRNSVYDDYNFFIEMFHENKEAL